MGQAAPCQAQRPGGSPQGDTTSLWPVESPHPGFPGDAEEMEGLTLDEQARGVHSLALDAVGPAGVGTSVLPANREHREAPVAHLGTREGPGAWAGTPRRTGKDPPCFPRQRAAGVFRAG